MAIKREEVVRTGRRRPVAIRLRTVEDHPSVEEARLREQELERLIIKAACRRARRLALRPGGEATEAGGIGAG